MAIADGRVEIAGHGQIENEQRPTVAHRLDAADEGRDAGDAAGRHRLVDSVPVRVRHRCVGVELPVDIAQSYDGYLVPLEGHRLSLG